MGRNGWAEIPSNVTNSNYIYLAHDKLPSNNALRNYSFCLDKTMYCALWVAYPLHAVYMSNVSRSDAFGYDPDVSTSYQANIGSNAYYPQGSDTYSYARGHQMPSADRNASDADNRTTFYATNMTPQLQTLNGGQWQQLEGKVRDWVCSDTLYVVTGAYFDPSITRTYAYDNKGAGKACPIPTHYYKVLLRTKAGSSGKAVKDCTADELQCIGFVYDHTAGSWTVPTNNTKSVAEIETMTGFTFFPNVGNAPKSTYSKTDWGL